MATNLQYRFQPNHAIVKRVLMEVHSLLGGVLIEPQRMEEKDGGQREGRLLSTESRWRRQRQGGGRGGRNGRCGIGGGGGGHSSNNILNIRQLYIISLYLLLVCATALSFPRGSFHRDNILNIRTLYKSSYIHYYIATVADALER